MDDDLPEDEGTVEAYRLGYADAVAGREADGPAEYWLKFAYLDGYEDGLFVKRRSAGTAA